MASWAGVGAVAVGASTMGGCASRSLLGMKSNQVRRSPSSIGMVSIIGAGTAGLTTAYKLMKAGVQCQIFEGENRRIGGRIITRQNFNQSNQFCEIGGELVDTEHEDLIALCGELGVGIQELKGPDVEENRKEMFFFNGRSYYDEDVLDKFAPMAEVLRRNKAKIFVDESEEEYKYDAEAEAVDNMSLEEFFDKECKGVDPLVTKMLRQAYMAEYGLELDQQSAANFLIYLPTKQGPDDFTMFGTSDEGKRIAGGNYSMIAALEKALSAGGVTIHHGHKLAGIRSATDKLELKFDGASPKTRSLVSEKIVFALPFTTLRNVEGIGAIGLKKEKVETIKKLGYGTNAKIMYNTKTRFWREDRNHKYRSQGSVITDEHFGQCWETSRGQAGTMGILTNFIGGKRGESLANAKPELFAPSMNKIFTGSSDQWVGKGVPMIWSKAEFVLGSYTCPKPGQCLNYVTWASESDLDGKVSFAGEHTSEDFNGYMGGAVESGFRVANEILGVTKEGEK